MSFLPLQFDDSLVSRSGVLVEVVLSRSDGIGIVVDREDAIGLAKALLKAARSPKQRGRNAHPRGKAARGTFPKRR